jgi:hypothetical protein
MVDLLAEAALKLAAACSMTWSIKPKQPGMLLGQNYS